VSVEVLAGAVVAHGGAGVGVAGVARRLLPADPDGAQNLVQEVFLRLWERPGDYDPSRGTLLG
jgi:hypothetical protein